MFGTAMAKRLSKALRGKRRWIGILVSSRYQTRSSLNGLISSVASTFQSERPIKLMEFHPSESDTAKTALEHLNTMNEQTVSNLGVAILQVPLELTKGVRALIETEDAIQRMEIKCITTSGKIRLVRERMALPKPARKRK
jgi:hypothetical protein